MFQFTKTTVSLIYLVTHHFSTVSGMVCNVFYTLDISYCGWKYWKQ